MWYRPHRRVDVALSWQLARKQFAALGAERDALRQELAETKREPASSVMPSYAKTLSGTEIDDLVAYLFGLRGE